MLASLAASIALLPGLLTGTVSEVSQQTPLPVLLPNNFYSDFDELYPYGGGDRKSYDIGVAAAPDCGGANACFARLPRAEGRHAVRQGQGDAGQGTPRPLPAARVRRLL